MNRRLMALLLAGTLLLAAGLGAASEQSDEGDANGDPPEEAHYGLCTAQENSEEGNEASNGTVQETPPFSNLSDEDCDDAEPPAPDDPGNGTDESDRGDDSDDGNQSSDPGSQGDEDRRD